ncbi:tail fiber assembly protein [Xenorhabdus bovienii]|uniref:Tail fiber assembly protein n=1 Tax=Xenorhabdus bovienii TaxID=40576 RepID=A0AAJ1JAB4_XENBV|nr:tail fiber assembly protein [Xenorhabdus bovienii]MDE1478333.1 tail fiber assembly protein [Xenorhabdus bovienii]MDE9510189.1 tail fiber assembly protein [Xenorhabdus bovienii]MDE9521830.1 tail fiber assembly protein [Xenorhabdus bovienii]
MMVLKEIQKLFTNIRNFKKYEPDDLTFGENVIYLISDDGQDWYECQKKYREDTLKVEYYEDGTIARVSRDASRLCPYNASVIEIEFDGELDIKQYYVSNDKVVRKDAKILAQEAKQETDRIKQALISDAQQRMQTLHTKLVLGRINKTEQQQLNQWLDYIDAIEAVDTSTAPDIQWPEQPQ